MELEIAFIISKNELFTLLQNTSQLSDSGIAFVKQVLNRSQIDDLNGLVEKKLAYIREGEVWIQPVIRMLVAGIARANGFESIDNGWRFDSLGMYIECLNYEHHPDHIKLIPRQKYFD